MRKRCTKCGETKPLTEFYKRSDGAAEPYRGRCKTCSRRGAGQNARRREIRKERPESAILSQMIQRCHNPSNPAFSNYGGRGIVVCDRWRESLSNFLEDLGPRPGRNYSVDRIDNDGNYEPGNCRWASRREQNRNTRQNVQLTIDGRTQCRTAWAEETGVPAAVIRDRMEKLGWDAKRAVHTPVRECRRAS